ncbi:MAG: hypothetical protein U1F43_20945 [Myxococcota bacterium]
MSSFVRPLLPFGLIASAALLAACPPSGNGRVVNTLCLNGVQDPTETGVDCGGTCGACAGEACTTAVTCASHVCDGTSCAAPTCTDTIRNGSETGIDCGGPCPACVAPQCQNHTQDPNETGVDCGGPCAACTTDTCHNQAQDPDEDGVDCGGPCTPCGVAPTCSDNFQNQGESDKDCGGPCQPCGDGKKCGGPADCVSTVCADGICGQAAASCTNEEKDPNETDKDCGGSCPGCATGKNCKEHSDCLSATCVFGVCRDPSCSDDVQNQGETAIDCGGLKCGDCDDGKTCDSGGDCISGACSPAGVCVSCSDETQNQDESDKDCGGVCAPCGLTKGCNGPSDCESNTCIDHTCREPGTSAGTCDIEADCEDGFFCEYTFNDQSGAAAAWDQQCLAEREGGQPGAACEVHDDCAGYGCFNGFCSAACGKDSDCLAGEVCASDEGLFDVDGDDQLDVLLPFEHCLGFASGSGACLSHADCGSGKRCTIYLDENLSGASLDPDGPYKAVGRCEAELSGRAAEGVQCQEDRECKSGVCSSQGICTRYCEASSECAPVAVSGFGTLKRVCTSRIPWGGGGLDDPTTYVHTSSCVALSGTHSLAPCGPTTATPFACATAGEACIAFDVAFGPDVKAKVEWLCLAVTGSGAIGDACSAPEDCATGYCLDASSGNGYCSRGCSTTADDCPSAEGMTCQLDELVPRKGKYLANGLSIGLCKH